MKCLINLYPFQNGEQIPKLYVNVVQAIFKKIVFFYRVKGTLQHGTKISVKCDKETMGCRHNNIFIMRQLVLFFLYLLLC